MGRKHLPKRPRAVEEIIQRARSERTASLDLSDQKLSALPDSVRELPHLKALYLDDNNLLHLPEWLGTLRNLQHLAWGGTS